MTRYLADFWEEIVCRAKAASRVIILLDYDGTLSPIALRPELASLPAKTREVLSRLNLNDKFEVGIISGRSLADIKALVGLEGLAYAGNHGLELECSKGSFVHPAAVSARPRLKKIYSRLAPKLAEINGVIVEDKGFSLSVHYRLVEKSAVERVKTLFREVIEAPRKGGEVRVTEGKKVIEVRPPVDWDKGRAVEWLLGHYRVESPLVIFAGDDVTDEDGFKFVNQISGISIRVGGESPATSAAYYVRSPGELSLALDKLSGLGNP